MRDANGIGELIRRRCDGRRPLPLGTTSAKFAALVSFVHLPAKANTSVPMSSPGTPQFR
jgi:hypothetical protein